MAPLVPAPDSLTPAWPHLGHTTVPCADSEVPWAKNKRASAAQGLSDSFCDSILKQKTVWFYRQKNPNIPNRITLVKKSFACNWLESEPRG